MIGGYKAVNITSGNGLPICESAAHDGDWHTVMANYASLPLDEPALLRMDVVRVIEQQPDFRRDSSSTTSCCSVDEGKREMKTLLQKFMEDFKRVYGETFADELLAEETRQADAGSPSTVVPELPRVPPRPPMRSTFFSAEDEGRLHPGIWCDRCGEVCPPPPLF